MPIVMPASLVDDGETANLYDLFSTTAQRIGVYTARDYSDILDHLVSHWKISSLSGLSGEAARAQDYLCALPNRYRKLADRSESKIADQGEISVPWICGRRI